MRRRIGEFELYDGGYDMGISYKGNLILGFRHHNRNGYDLEIFGYHKPRPSVTGVDEYE